VMDAPLFPGHPILSTSRYTPCNTIPQAGMEDLPAQNRTVALAGASPSAQLSRAPLLNLRKPALLPACEGRHEGLGLALHLALIGGRIPSSNRPRS
jgi:hypothetical protein